MEIETTEVGQTATPEVETNQSTSQDESDFAAGFAAEATPQVHEEQTDDGAIAQVESAATVEATPEPEPNPLAMIEERINALQSNLDKRHDAAMGKYGELNRTLQEMKQAAPGKPLQLSGAQLKNLSEDFPEFAELIAKDFSEIVFPAGTSQGVSDEEIQSKIEPKLQTLEQKMEIRTLSVLHRDFRNVLASDDFKAWTATLPETDRETLGSTWDSEFIAGKLDDFKADKKAKDEARAKEEAAKGKQTPSKAKERLEAAVTPRGVASNGPAALTEAELFNAGFKVG